VSETSVLDFSFHAWNFFFFSFVFFFSCRLCLSLFFLPYFSFLLPLICMYKKCVNKLKLKSCPWRMKMPRNSNLHFVSLFSFISLTSSQSIWVERWLLWGYVIVFVPFLRLRSCSIWKGIQKLLNWHDLVTVHSSFNKIDLLGEAKVTINQKTEELWLKKSSLDKFFVIFSQSLTNRQHSI